MCIGKKSDAWVGRRQTQCGKGSDEGGAAGSAKPIQPSQGRQVKSLHGSIREILGDGKGQALGGQGAASSAGVNSPLWPLAQALRRMCQEQLAGPPAGEEIDIEDL